MIAIDIPGAQTLRIEHIALDYNGTLAVDGKLLPGVAERLRTLAEHVVIHILTADTFGSAAKELTGLPVTLRILPPEAQDEAKRIVVAGLSGEVMAVGNGRNDVLMLREAALGVAIVQAEGASSAALREADVVSLSVVDALDLLLRPDRLRATLRK